MRSDDKIISKGTYSYPQISGLISVKNYIFARRQGKKCLFLRFVNDADWRITAMSFIILQMDASGEPLGQISIDCASLDIAGGGVYSYDSGIVIDEYCSDFKVVFTRVVSDDYIYTVRNGKIAVLYDIPEEELYCGEKKAGKKEKKLRHATARRKRFDHPKLATFLVILLFVFTLVFNAIYIYAVNMYTKPTKGTETAESATAEAQTVVKNAEQ